ncbi:acyltransferase family protein [Aliiglaciecola aliphaticivorans]
MERLKGIDGLRAIAVSMVIFSHSIGSFHLNSFGLVGDFLGNGGLGVRIFFVISGFLITFLLLKENKLFGIIDFNAFFVRRSLRIFPAFFAYILVVTLFAYYDQINVSKQQILSAATFSWNYGHVWMDDIGPDGWFLGHFWTLALEEQYYLFLPLTILLFGLARLPYYLLFITVMMPIVRVVSYFLFPESRGQLGMMFHTAIDPILIGTLGAFLFFEKSKILNGFAFKSKPLLICAILILFLISPMLAHNVRGYETVLGITIESLMVLYVIIWLQLNPGTFAVRILESRALVFIGMISYSLYLWQQLFLTELNTVLNGVGVNVMAVFFVAVISYYFIEKPFLNIRRNRRKEVIV